MKSKLKCNEARGRERTDSWGWWAWECGSRYRRGPRCQGPCTRRRSRQAGGRRGWRCRAQRRCQRPWGMGTQRRWASFGPGTPPLSSISAGSPFLTPSHLLANGTPETLRNSNQIHIIFFSLLFLVFSGNKQGVRYWTLRRKTIETFFFFPYTHFPQNKTEFH